MTTEIIMGETVVGPDKVSWRVVNARIWDEVENAYVAVLRGDWNHRVIIHKLPDQ